MYLRKSSLILYIFCSIVLVAVVIAKINYFTEQINKLMYAEYLPPSRINDYQQHGWNAINKELYRLNIYPPSRFPYTLSNPEIEDPSHGQSKIIDKYFNNKKNGFFIESGAFDGEKLSNTLFFERFRNWTGLLVEPNPSLFVSLINKNRKAYSMKSCLSTKTYPSTETFNLGKNPVFGRVVENNTAGVNDSPNKVIRVQCFPLISILQAINQFEIDYFSLDVEGAEEGVLKTLPWDRVNIRTISIEHNKWPDGKHALVKFMKMFGYKVMTEIKNDTAAPDFIFEKETHGKN